MAEGTLEVTVYKEKKKKKKAEGKTDYISSRAPLLPARSLVFLRVLERFSDDSMECFSCCTFLQSVYKQLLKWI